MQKIQFLTQKMRSYKPFKFFSSQVEIVAYRDHRSCKNQGPKSEDKKFIQPF